MKSNKKALSVLLAVVMIFTLAIGNVGAESLASNPQITLENGNVLPINAVNQERGADQLAIFTRQIGERTTPFGEDTVEYVILGDVLVGKYTDGNSGTLIPTNGYVLSASGTAAQQLGDLEIGITITTQNITITTQNINILNLPQKYFSVQGNIVGIDRINEPRLESEVVLYDPSYGPSTGANAWGLEITVSSGIVTRIVGIEYDAATGQFLANDSLIPSEGYVISIQASSPYYNQLNGVVAVGQPATLVLDSLNPQITLENGTVFPVNAVNQDRGTDQLAVFTREIGERTTPFGEDTVEYVIVGDVLVGKYTNGNRGTLIPTNGYVLSASGTAVQQLGDLEIGITITTQNINIPNLPQKYFAVQGNILGIDRINGLRLESEVVLYDPSYGPSTGANAWGLEITVSSGIVTRVVGIEYDAATGQFLANDSPIPSDGYVISIQASSPFYSQLNGVVAVGQPATLVLDSLQFSAGKISYDAFNPSTFADNPGGHDGNGQPYPGYRGTNQLIVYNSSYGTSTGTNPWGFEVIVNEDGYIIAIGGNDNLIPAGGYVLSAHGVKHTWLTNQAIIGAKVRIDHVNKQLLIMFTPESELKKAEFNIANAENNLQTSRSKFLDVPYADINQKILTAKTLYNQAKAAYDNGDTAGLMSLLDELNQPLSDAHFMNFESRKVDTRGLWIRPKETNIEQVREHLNKMKAININSVYIETWFDGYTIFPTNNQYATQNPMYNGFDVLKAYIDEAKKLDIEIHAWVENFFIGGLNAGYPDEWLMVSRRGEKYGVDQYGQKWYYLNPALPAVRDFVSSIHEELLTKYKVASLHLDYARYGESGDYTNDYGYDEYTRNLFKEQTGGVDPLDLQPGDPHWVEWLDFRTNIINTWVERVAEETRQTQPETLITVAVWPNYEEAPHSHAQETKNWVDKNIIDHIMHMSYVPDASQILIDLNKSLEVADGKSFVTSGIGTFIQLTKEELVRQINAAVLGGADGTALFEFESLFNDRYDRELKLGVYRNQAIMPDYRKTEPVSALLKDMIRKTNEIYIPFQGISDKDARQLKNHLDSAVKMLEKETNMRQGIAQSVKNRLQSIQKDISKSNMQTEVKNRLNFDLNFALSMIDLYFTKSGK